MIASNAHLYNAVATDGADISSRTKQKEYMAKNNLVPYEPGMFDAGIKKREEVFKGADTTRKQEIANIVNSKGG